MMSAVNCKWCVAILFVVAVSQGADWLGDAQPGRWQPRERELTPASVGKLQMIWKFRPEGGAAMSAPVIFGRVISYRGSVELVIVSTGTDVYAIDGDFGKLFWKRHLDDGGPSCGHGVVTPSIAPLPAGTTEEQEDDDGPQPLRPISVMSGGARLYSLKPEDGKDVKPPGDVSCVEPVRATTSQGKGWRYSIQESKLVAAGEKGSAWLRVLGAPSAPVLAGGVVFVVSNEGSPKRAVLYGLDALTGKELYSSRDALGTTALAANLAVANGHVCFTGDDQVLYCFGFPVDQ